MIKFKIFISKNYQAIIVGVVILIFIVYVAVTKHELKNLQYNNDTTLCKVNYSAWLAGEGRYICKFYFFVQNRKYYGVEVHYNKNCFIGDYYKIVYDPKKPKVNKIDFKQKFPIEEIVENFPDEYNLFEHDTVLESPD